jgi:hypothetical protein
LGPLLFIIYVNDIYKAVDYSKLILFADDTNVIVSSDSIDDLQAKAESDLKLLSKWFSLNKLSLNASKTKCILFQTAQSSARNNTDFALKLNGTLIEQVESTKFLGVTIDKTLCWKEHINNTAKTIAKTIGVMGRLKHVLPKHILKTLYSALVQPHLQYGMVSWCNISKSNINRLFILQKKALRIIEGNRFRDHTEPLFKKAGILKLHDLHNMKVIGVIERFYKHKATPFLSYLLRTIATGISARTNNFSMPPIRLDIERQLILYKIPKLYNALPMHLKHGVSRKSFKSHVINQYSEMGCEIKNCFVCASK